MKVLLSAYACAPGQGSEPEVGYQALLAAARHHEVWVLTQQLFVDRIEKGVADDGASGRVHVEGIAVPGLLDRAGELRGLPRQHLHYDRWQRRAARRAAELDAQVGFDLLHHVTLSAYWARIGVVGSGRGTPLVLGPLGGAVGAPLLLWPVMGARGLAEHTVRIAAQRAFMLRPSVRRPYRMAAEVLAGNRETLERLPGRTARSVFPHATAITIPELRWPTGRSKDIVVASRLDAFKGVTLAVRALSHVADPDARLVVYGRGRERGRIERTARRRGVSDRLVFADRVSRHELLERMAASAVLLHPSLHEQGGLAVAEALAVGTPVVILDRGGPVELCRRSWPDTPSVLVRPTTPEATARRLAAGIDRFLADPAPMLAAPRPPTASFAESMLEAYDRALAS